MKVDLKSGQAVVSPAKDSSFDPARIPRAISDAGFTPGEIEIAAAGILREADEGLALALPGPPGRLALAGGARLDELKSRHDLAGRQVRVTGWFRAPPEERPPNLSVEKWELLTSP